MKSLRRTKTQPPTMGEKMDTEWNNTKENHPAQQGENVIVTVQWINGKVTGKRVTVETHKGQRVVHKSGNEVEGFIITR